MVDKTNIVYCIVLQNSTRRWPHDRVQTVTVYFYVIKICYYLMDRIIRMIVQWRQLILQVIKNVFAPIYVEINISHTVGLLCAGWPEASQTVRCCRINNL